MDARQLIVLADELRRDEGITQAEWCRRAGFDEFGKLVSNTFRRGNCKLSVFAQLLKPLGYEIRIVRQEEKHELQGHDNGTGRTERDGQGIS